MPKIIALQNPHSRLAKFLHQSGYVIADFYATHADARLYTCYHPDHTSILLHAHISCGFQLPNQDDDPLEINITGLTPTQVLELLQQRLRSPVHKQ